MILPGRGSNRPGRDRLRFHDMSVKACQGSLQVKPTLLLSKEIYISIYRHIKVG